MDYSVKLNSAAEKAMFDLRALYGSYGYAPYAVGKFEEYDFYAQNKSFITGDSILTFTDTDGTLMALKPDITLSIVKSTKPGGDFLRKVYYNENVYRAQDESGGFREIMQTGLECIGALDIYSICEVITLAVKSLEAINGDYLLDISHMGLLPGFLEDIGVYGQIRSRLLRCAEEKNIHDAAGICRENGIEEAHIETLGRLLHLRGGLSDALASLSEMNLGQKAKKAAAELSELSEALGLHTAKHIFLDLSLLGDERYYNGVIFRGFINGASSSVLSGGRYDMLLKKMGKAGGAIGFALYLDRLGGRTLDGDGYDFDVLILAGENDPPADIAALAEQLRSGGESVRVDRCVPEGLKNKRFAGLREGYNG